MTVRDNPEKNRFELDVEGEIAFANYRRGGDVLSITHTEVPRALNGKGYGSALVAGLLADVRARGLKVKPLCGFVAAYLHDHPDQADLVA